MSDMEDVPRIHGEMPLPKNHPFVMLHMSHGDKHYVMIHPRTPEASYGYAGLPQAHTFEGAHDMLEEEAGAIDDPEDPEMDSGGREDHAVALSALQKYIAMHPEIHDKIGYGFGKSFGYTSEGMTKYGHYNSDRDAHAKAAALRKSFNKVGVQENRRGGFDVFVK